MAVLSLEKVSAMIRMGAYVFATPGRLERSAGDIMSFSVTRNRNDPIAKLNASFSAWLDSSLMSGNMAISNDLGDKITVKAGVDVEDLDSLPTLFTGYVTSLRTRPHWGDAQRLLEEISAEDVFVKMRVDPKFSRRFKMTGDAFAIIVGGKRRQSGNMTQVKRMPPGRQGISYLDSGSAMKEHSPLIKTPDPQGKSPHGVQPPRSDNKGVSDPKRVPNRAKPSKA